MRMKGKQMREMSVYKITTVQTTNYSIVTKRAGEAKPCAFHTPHKSLVLILHKTQRARSGAEGMVWINPCQNVHSS